MAWTVPKTFTAASALTAAELNTHLRDNTTWLKAALSTHNITSDSTVQAILSARYGVSALTSSESAPTDTDVGVDFSEAEEEYKDVPAMHSNSAPPRFYPQGSYTYECKAWASFEGHATGNRTLWIERSDGTIYNTVRVATLGSGTQTAISTSAYVELTSGQYVRLMVRQSSGSTLDITARFQMQRVGA